MVFLIGFGIRYAYKSYKKHQAKKERKETLARGIHPEIMDPSSELSVGVRHGISDSDDNTLTERTFRHRDSSTTSISSASSVELEARLQDDEEFQMFIRRQTKVYLDQQRLLKEYGVNNSGLGASRSPSAEHGEVQPPAYNVIMAADERRSRGSSGASSGTIELNDGEARYRRSMKPSRYPVAAELPSPTS